MFGVLRKNIAWWLVIVGTALAVSGLIGYAMAEMWRMASW